MQPGARHVVIVGGPEEEAELLVIVLGEDRAVPLFGDVEEAEDFLESLGEFGGDWVAHEVSARTLIDLLEYQGDDVGYVALSPPPEKLTGGMEVQVLERGLLIGLLHRQADAAPEPAQPEPPGARGFLRRLFGR
jgi:hypothetical protein